MTRLLDLRLVPAAVAGWGLAFTLTAFSARTALIVAVVCGVCAVAGTFAARSRWPGAKGARRSPPSIAAPVTELLFTGNPTLLWYAQKQVFTWVLSLS